MEPVRHGSGIVGCTCAEIPWRTPEEEVPVFTIFQSLLIELRRKIWVFAFPEPRILHLENSRGSSYRYTGQPLITMSIWRMGEYQNKQFHKHAMIMSLTCRESRGVFLENYAPVKLRGSSIASLWDEDAELEVSDIGTKAVEQCDTYIDHKRDTLYVSGGAVEELASCGAWIDVSEIRHLAVQSSPTCQTFGSAALISEFIEQCPNLRTLKIALGGNPPDLWYGEWPSYSFLEIDNTFDFILARNSPDAEKPQLSNHERTIQIQGCRTSVCLVGGIGEYCYGRDCDIVCLVPVQTKYHGVSFHTHRPREPVCTPEDQHSMWIEALDCEIPCEHDGTPHTYFDGEAMQRLFEERT